MAEPEHKELRDSLENMLENVEREVIRPKQKVDFLSHFLCVCGSSINDDDSR